jgi:hypothetical protein
MSAKASTALRLADSLDVVALQNERHAVFTAGIVVLTFAFGAFVADLAELTFDMM